MSHSETNYSALTPKLAVQLAAPHTWPASVMPALIALACSCATGSVIQAHVAVILLTICILMQSSVNTFNDYFDYVKGTDSIDDNVEITDATLVYNNINPKHALKLALGFLSCAFLMGLYIIYIAGFIPLLIALIGAFFVVAYSAGKTPISYLPIGELVSGTVMGMLIPLACYYTITGSLNPLLLVWAIPEALGVGLIMFTNNLCDIDKDILAKRKTLPVILGYSKARKLYQYILICMIACMILVIAIWFSNGMIILPFMLIASYPMMKALNSNPLLPTTRIAGMAQVCTINVVLGAFYASAILASSSSIIF